MKDVAIARAHRERRVPTIEQTKKLLHSMAANTPIEMCDRALIALTGARDNAVASLRLKHIDVIERLVFQDGRDVSTKFSKTISTWFFPVGEEFENVVAEWVRYLREELKFGPEDALFPQTVTDFIAYGPVTSLGRAGWATADSIRKIFKTAFGAAGMPYFNPDSFRHMLVRYGMEVCTSPEQFKAWSQNIGHDGVLTTFNSYGNVPSHRQRELIREIVSTDPDDALAMKLGRAALEVSDINALETELND